MKLQADLVLRHPLARYQGRIHDLARHRKIALLVQLPLESLHHPLEPAAFGQPIAKKPDRVLVWCLLPRVEACEPHPGQPVLRHELGASILAFGLFDIRHPTGGTL